MSRAAAQTSTKKPAPNEAGKSASNPMARVEMFVREYIIDFNGTRAAVKAGFSAHTAASQASRLLKNVKVIAMVEEAKREREKRLQIDADWVLRRLTMELEADLAEIYDENDKLKPIHEWPLIFRTGLISGIESDEIWEGTGKDRVLVGYTRKVKNPDRFSRLVAAGKHVKVNAFKETVKLDASDELRKAFEAMTGKVFTPGGGA